MYSAERTKARGVTFAYRAYVTDSLQNAPQGKCLQRRWADLMRPREDIDVEATIERVMAALEG